jgi:hypothetical protein
MRRLILLCISICVVLTATGQSKVLFKNTVDNELDYPGKSLDSFLSFSKYRAVIFGETHTVYFEPEFKLSLIKQLNDEQGIRDIFMEIGHSAAYIFNRFLATGDTMLFQHPRPAYTWTPGNYRKFWEALYHYNQALSEDKKIIIHGVDFERQEVFKTLLLLKPKNKPIPSSLSNTFQLLERYAASATDDAFDKMFIMRLDTINSQLKSNADIVRGFYEDNYDIVSYIIHNKGPHTTRTPKRNKTMFQNMREIIAKDHIDKLVGFFGAAHTDYQTKSSIPNRIDEIADYKGKVLNLTSLYYNVYSKRTESWLDYVGLVKHKHSGMLYDLYLTSAYRATLVRSGDVKNKLLRGSADYVLFATDNPKK